MNRVMKEANYWRKKYTGAFKKHGKVLIEVLIKKQVYENKIRMEMQQQKMKKRSGFQKLGIVISGWPAVGKTTVARELAREFGLKLYNGGDILKMIAKEKGYSITGMDWWDTDDAKKFMAERKANLFFDK